MKSTIEIIEKLNQILIVKEPFRMELIKSFQNEVWNDEFMEDKLYEILSELAYDLDFYESNEKWRKEDSSYYGEERLEGLIKSGIQKIEEYTKGLL